MISDDVPRPVLDAYPDVHATRIESLGACGGFSGALFWRLDSHRGELCLRRWPKEHPDEARLQFIHAVIRHVATNGFDGVPVPVMCRDGCTFVSHAGHLWELAPWLRGEANYHQDPSDAKLRAAMQSLAQFHTSAATFPRAAPCRGNSPGIQSRWDFTNRLASSDLDKIAAHVRPGDWPELVSRARRLLDLFPPCAGAIKSVLTQAIRAEIALQPCIRDIWHDHVLFCGDSVSGFVDFGATRIETVAGDIARLLGSLIRDDAKGWQTGIDSYHAKRPLMDEERKLVRVFDRSNVLLSGMNWLQWIYVEGRRFDQRTKIIERLDENISRLEKFLETECST